MMFELSFSGKSCHYTSSFAKAESQVTLTWRQFPRLQEEVDSEGFHGIKAGFSCDSCFPGAFLIQMLTPNKNSLKLQKTWIAVHNSKNPTWMSQEGKWLVTSWDIQVPFTQLNPPVASIL